MSFLSEVLSHFTYVRTDNIGRKIFSDPDGVLRNLGTDPESGISWPEGQPCKIGQQQGAGFGGISGVMKCVGGKFVATGVKGPTWASETIERWYGGKPSIPSSGVYAEYYAGDPAGEAAAIAAARKAQEEEAARLAAAAAAEAERVRLAAEAEQGRAAGPTIVEPPTVPVPLATAVGGKSMSFLGGLVGGVTGFLTGGPAGAVVGAIAGSGGLPKTGGGAAPSPVPTSIGTSGYGFAPSTPGCGSGYVWDPATGMCKRTGVVGVAERVIPGGATGYVPAGDVVTEILGPGRAPVQTVRRTCGKGMLLAENGLCYSRKALPAKYRASKARKAPFTWSDKNHVRKARAAQKRLIGLTNDAGAYAAKNRPATCSSKGRKKK